MYLPLGILLLLATVWSAFWFIAAQKVEDGFLEWQSREQSKGREFTCDQKNVGGYPFRITLECAGPKMVLNERRAELTFSAIGLKAIAQIYNPYHVIAELAGPAEISHTRRDSDGQPDPLRTIRLKADWSLARTSVVLKDRHLDELSVILTAPRIAPEPATAAALTAKSLGFFIRRPPSDTNFIPGHYEIASTGEDVALEGVVAEPLQPVLGQLKTTGLRATVTHLPPRLRADFEAQLEQWARKGGRAEIAELKLIGATGAALAGSGNAHLAQDGALVGELNADIAGLDRVLGAFVSDEKIAKDAAALVMTGLGIFAQKTEIEGQPAVRLPLSSDGTRLSIGPVPIAAAPKLF